MNGQTILKLKCPTCGIEYEPDLKAQHAPFCSPRCQLIDLGRWLNEDIGLPHLSMDEDLDVEELPEDRPRAWTFDD